RPPRSVAQEGSARGFAEDEVVAAVEAGVHECREPADVLTALTTLQGRDALVVGVRRSLRVRLLARLLVERRPVHEGLRGMLVAEAVPLREQRDALSELVLADEDRLRGGDVPGVVPAEGRTGRVAVDFVVVAVRHSLDRGRERGLVDAWAVRGVRLARE